MPVHKFAERHKGDLGDKRLEYLTHQGIGVGSIVVQGAGKVEHEVTSIHKTKGLMNVKGVYDPNHKRRDIDPTSGWRKVR